MLESEHISKISNISGLVRNPDFKSIIIDFLQALRVFQSRSITCTSDHKKIQVFYIFIRGFSFKVLGRPFPYIAGVIRL